MTATFTVSDARESFAEVLQRSAIEEVFIEKHNKAVAVVLSPDVFEMLRQAWEDLEDIKAIQESIEAKRPLVFIDDLRKELGL